MEYSLTMQSTSAVSYHPTVNPVSQSSGSDASPSTSLTGELVGRTIQQVSPPAELPNQIIQALDKSPHTYEQKAPPNHHNQLKQVPQEALGALYKKTVIPESVRPQNEQKLKNEIESQWGLTVSNSSNRQYPWKVKGDSLEQSFRFKSLEEMHQALEAGYLRRTAKHLAAIERLGRGRDVHNVTSLTKMDTGPVLVIDGGDDLAVSLENSGLPRSLVLAVQSTALYPAFISVVYKGWQGANDEYIETREEYQALIESQQALKKEIHTLVTQELSLKEQLLDTSDNSEAQQQLRDALLNQNQFKTTLLSSIEPLLTASNNNETDQVPDAQHLKDTIQQLDSFKKQLTEHNQAINKQLTDSTPSSELQQLLAKLNNSQLFDPTSSECHELIQQLAEYKANQDDKLAKFADAHIATAFTESGLSGMYWGMVSFEARAATELLVGEASLPFSHVLSQMGDTFNVLGQAQMVIAGLTKAGLGVREVKSLNEWLDQIKNTNALNNPDQPELAKTKAIIDQFYHHQRNVTIGETVGNSVLTLGQLGMILGGPFGVGVSSVLYAGVGATIGGVAMSQVAAQYSNKVFNVSEEKSAKEQEISQWTNKDKNPLEIIQQRIGKLYELSQEQATPKVWLNIYQTLAKKPEISSSEVLTKVEKQYQKYDTEHSGHYRQLYRQALDNINNDRHNTIDIINKAKSLLQKDINETNTHTAFSAFISTHIQQLQNVAWVGERPDTAAGQIRQLFQFAEQQGFTKEFERRTVKRLINQNGYITNKETKVDPSSYITKIEANKSKRPWQIPNPIAPVINLGRLIKQLIKPVANPSFLSPNLSLPINWGKKDTAVYAFNRDQFLEDLNTLNSESSEGKNLHRLCQTLFTEQMTNDAKTWLGKDNRHVFEETMRHIGKQMLRDNVLRPIVHGVSEQVKLADLIEQLQKGQSV